MAGAHSDVLEQLVATNMELSVGYGNDEYSACAKAMIREALPLSNAIRPIMRPMPDAPPVMSTQQSFIFVIRLLCFDLFLNSRKSSTK